MSTFTEEADYDVTITVRMTRHVYFALADRDGPITKADAIANAIGSLPDSFYKELDGNGWDVALPIEGEAELERQWSPSEKDEPR